MNKQSTFSCKNEQNIFADKQNVYKNLNLYLNYFFDWFNLGLTYNDDPLLIAYQRLFKHSQKAARLKAKLTVKQHEHDILGSLSSKLAVLCFKASYDAAVSFAVNDLMALCRIIKGKNPLIINSEINTHLSLGDDLYAFLNMKQKEDWHTVIDNVSFILNTKGKVFKNAVTGLFKKQEIKIDQEALLKVYFNGERGLVHGILHFLLYNAGKSKSLQDELNSMLSQRVPVRYCFKNRYRRFNHNFTMFMKNFSLRTKYFYLRISYFISMSYAINSLISISTSLYHKPLIKGILDEWGSGPVSYLRAIALRTVYRGECRRLVNDIGNILYCYTCIDIRDYFAKEYQKQYERA